VSSRLARLTSAVRQTELSRFLGSLPPVTVAAGLAAIFCLFATIGLVNDIVDFGRGPAALVAANVLFSGSIAVAYAYAFTRRLAVLPFVIAAHLGYVLLVDRLVPDQPETTALPGVAARLRIDALLILVGVVLGYNLFIGFVTRAGRQHLRVQTEIALAREIHRVLVPDLSLRLGEYELFGLSRASGEVGGDLVDVVGADGPWIGYVADVTGHGVSSGLLMGMTKSAARMKLRQGLSVESLLDDLNQVLLPLKSPSMFVTFVCVVGRDGGELEFSVAGHLPILHVRRNGAVDEVTTPQIPLGVLEGHQFRSARLACAPGELLALVTDGLTEVFDRSDREFGLDAVKTYLASNATRPLAAIASGLIAAAASHGAQMDDQTLLLVRRVSRPD
jgi:serine phosphatase RsbU (regulator of sigma subunit)